MKILTFIADTGNGAAQAVAEESHKAGIFEALGIDWKLLLLQSIAFLVLVVLLGKFVYPVLIRSIDKRREDLDSSAKAAEQAEKNARESEERVAKALREARKQADEMITASQKEAAAVVEAAEAKASKRAEHIVSEAKAQLDNDIRAAQVTLKKETMQLVAQATEKIIKQKLDAPADAALVDQAVQGKSS